MASTIKIKRSSTGAAIPSGLSAGELAINIPDKRLYSSDGATTFRVGDVELANTNARINLVNTNLTGTNTALRTLISDRLQVANAAATYQTKSVERAALANTNASIATQSSRITLVNTNLTGTNTALRSLISDRLQVANAAATYQTKVIERAALANTNSYIATKVNTTTFNSALANTNTYIATKVNTTTFNSALANTNTYIATKITNSVSTTLQTRSIVPETDEVYNLGSPSKRFKSLYVSGSTIVLGAANLTSTGAGTLKVGNQTLVSNAYLTSTYIANTTARSLIFDRLQVANAASLYATKVNPTTSGILAHTGRATISTNLGVTGNTTIGGSLVVTGDLTINGTTTTLNSTTLTVDDINITLGDTATPTNASADGGGITLKGTTDKTFNWVSATASWTSSENINIASTKTLFLNGIDFRSIYAANSYVKSVLANTNSFIKSQLANTNASIATQTSRITLVNTNLTGTNTALRTLINDRLQVANATATYQTKSAHNIDLANTNSYIATQSSRITLVNTNLTGTNTALRTLISDRLQVANAAATYQTKAVERAALANTNAYIGTQVSRITLVNTNLTGTNTALRTLISDRLQVANAAAVYATKSNPTTSGLLAHTGRATISTNLAVSGNTTLSGTLVANSTSGTSGYYLRTSGSGIYWSPIAAASTTQYLQVANAVAIYATKISPSTSGFFNHTGRLTVGTNLLVSGNTRITGTTIIDGDLTVEGAVTYISSSTLNVDDSMIKLAANNSTDAVDVGFYGKYDSSGVKYSGLFRDASDGIYKIYTGLQSEPTSTVNIGGTGYALAQLDAIIDGGTY